MPRDKVRMEYSDASILLSLSPKMYTSLIFIYEYMIRELKAPEIKDCHVKYSFNNYKILLWSKY